MPRTCLPYMFFILTTPKIAHAFSSASESSSNGNDIFCLNFSCEAIESRDTPKIGPAGLHELRVQVAELQPLVGAAGGVVLGIEVEDERVALEGRELEALVCRWRGARNPELPCVRSSRGSIELTATYGGEVP